MKFDIESLKWDKLRYDNNSNFNGALRYPSAACTFEGRILLTGGCLISTGDAVQTTYETSVSKPSKFTRKR